VSPRSRGDVLRPAPDRDELTGALARFLDWLARRHNLRFHDYGELWRWSTNELEAFWGSVWDYYEVGAGRPGTVLAGRVMPGADWFPGAQLNYAEEVLRRAPRGDATVLFMKESQPLGAIGYDELRGQVGAFAATLRNLGVGPGDRVAGFLPNVPEAVIALLATASLGAVWTACAPDFGTQSVLDRFLQVDPVVMVATDGYRFNGRSHDRRDVVDRLQRALPSLRATILVSSSGERAQMPSTIPWADTVTDTQEPEFASLPFGHPLWILFSSGTTGIPKGIVQSHGGIVLEHLKALNLGSDIRAGDRFYFFSSTSWMVWNWMVGGLLVGATPVLFDGSPVYPDATGSWQIVAETRANIFGTGAAYLTGTEKAGLDPARAVDTSALRSLISTGSPLPTSTWGWLHDVFDGRVRLESSSGGTDVCSALVSGSPWLPVYVGELSGSCLGVKAQAWDDAGRSVVGQVGELVIAEPMPSMPIYFWNDPDGSRYRDAYFSRFDGVWRHGDWVEITERGSVIVSGRSDATLNKAGVRMGSADIYAIVDPLPGVADSLVIGVELPDGGYYMPLFVVPEPDADLEELRSAIKAAIRRDLSPRHVPDEILAAPGVPRTLTGKRLEVPIKQILRGAEWRELVSPGAVSNPQDLDWYAAFGRSRVVPLMTATV
jgi:acetoacetyl-CoA synthetase